MIKKVLATLVLFIIFLHPQIIHAEGYKYVEIFDPKKDNVVKVVEISKEINNMVLGWING